MSSRNIYWRAKTVYGGVLRNLMNTIVGVGVSQANLWITKRGVEIGEVDTSQHICLMMVLEAEGFDEYMYADKGVHEGAEQDSGDSADDCGDEGELIIAVDLFHLTRVLKGVSTGHVVTFTLCDSDSEPGTPAMLHVQREMGGVMKGAVITYTLNLLELDAQRIKVNDKDCVHTVELRATTFNKIVKEFYGLTPNGAVSLGIDPDGAFFMHSVTSSGNASVRIVGKHHKQRQSSTSDVIPRLESTHYIKDLLYISRAACVDDQVRLCFRTAADGSIARAMEPIILRYNIGTLGKVMFIVIATSAVC